MKRTVWTEDGPIGDDTGIYDELMTMTASASTPVSANPQTILEFVLDLERYKQADHKITRVSKVHGPDDDGRGYVKVWGKLKGLPPAPDRQDFTLERWHKLTFVGAPKQPGRMVFNFVGTFECEEAADGTTWVTHAYKFDFHGPFKLLEKRLAPWLQSEVEAEVALIAEILS